MKRTSRLAKTFATTLAIGAMFSFVLASQPKAAEHNEAKTYELLNLFGEVFERVRNEYVDETEDRKLIEAAISGMLNSLDPHSTFLDAETFSEMQVQNKGEFGGLGIEVTMENGLVKVVSPIDDTPAFNAGIQPGDLISHLDGEAVLGMTLSDAVDRMRGAVGTDIKLMVIRGTQDPFEVVITRAVITIRTVRTRLIDDIAYVRITQFNAQALAGLEKAFRKFDREPGVDKLKGVVLDLRSNPGGLLDQAVSISDAFLERGEIVSIGSKRRPEETQRFNARGGDLAKGLPLVVLINGGSASASEIVAGAIQDQGRGILLGTKSFGKGSVQTIHPMNDYGAIKITTSRYYTPSGRSIQSVGISPDIFVPRAKVESLEPDAIRRERDLRGALDKDNGDKEKEDAKVDDKPDAETKPKNDNGENGNAAVVDDYQLTRALDLIRGITLYQDISANGRK